MKNNILQAMKAFVERSTKQNVLSNISKQVKRDWQNNINMKEQYKFELTQDDDYAKKIIINKSHFRNKD